MDILTVLGGSSIVAYLIIEWLKKGIKKWATPRFSDLAVLTILFGISLLLSLGNEALKLIPVDFLVFAGNVFAYAIALYQVLKKAVYDQVIKNRTDN